MPSNHSALRSSDANRMSGGNLPCAEALRGRNDVNSTVPRADQCPMKLLVALMAALLIGRSFAAQTEKAGDAAPGAEATVKAAEPPPAGKPAPSTAAARKQKIDRAIREKMLVVGMTPAEAIRSWGEPTKKNTRQEATGPSEQWIYGRDLHSRTYVYFENGELKSWQETR
jgi:hypothetical protein